MNLTAQFKEFLYSQVDPASSLTVKNYISDINKFIRWFEAKFDRDFQADQVNQVLINSFKKDSLVKYSASSVDRSLSSLRKFFYFLKLNGHISDSPFEQQPTVSAEALAKADPWRIRDFKNHLYASNASHLTIKNYIIDIKQFLNWVEKVLVDQNSWEASQNQSFERLNKELIDEYKKRLLSEARFSPVSVNRKLSSIRRYISWATDEGLIGQPTQFSNLRAGKALAPTEALPKAKGRAYSGFAPVRLIQKTKNGVSAIFDSLLTNPLGEFLEDLEQLLWIIKGRPVFKEAQNLNFKTQKSTFQPLSSKFYPPSTPYSQIRNFPKSFYAPAHVSTKYFSLHKKILHHARNTRPKWYKRYHSYSFVSYLHFSILMLFISMMGYVIFNSFTPQKQPPTLAATPTSPLRILSFQGRLTDSSDSPITTQTSLRMAIYNSEAASGSALLWQEIVSPTPDNDGVFSIILGKNTPIPQSLFAQNSALWLGVSVQQTSELKPRQQIATVAFATNSETLQGLPPITNTSTTSNVVLALNSSGNLTIGGSSSPTFQATGGTFTLSGQTLVLTTNSGSNGNISLNPNGTGIIDLQKVIKNTSNNNSLVPGSVQVDDLFAINATSSGAAIYISQSSSGDLIIASKSGTTKFKVDGGGSITASGTINGLTVSSGTITSGTWNGTAISSTYGGTGINSSSSTGVPFVSSGTWAIDTNYLAANHGGTGQTSYSVGDILYASSSSALARLAVGTSSQCLIGGTNPSWSSCSGASSNWWGQTNGAIYPLNSTVDLLLGAQATSSSKFAVLNVNSGTPTASISANSGNNATYITGDGTLATTNRGTITIGSSSTYNTSGNILLAPNGTGNVGIGKTNPLFRLDLTDSQSATAAAQIFNSDTGTDADGLIVKLGNSSTTAVSTTNHFLSFETSGIGIVGSIQGTGGKNVAYQTSGIADFAEYMRKDPSETIEWGSIVCQSINGNVVPCTAISPNIVGVASEFPTFVGGENLGVGSITVGLTGIVSTKVSNINGDISSGDYITSSNIPGVGVKASGPGAVVGIALKDHSSSESGKILVRVNPSWYDPNVQLADTGYLSLRPTVDNNFEVQRDGRTIDRIGAFSDLVVAKIKSGYFETGKLIVNGSAVVKNLTAETLASTTANFSQLSTDSIAVLSQQITVGGESLRDYIASIVNEIINNRAIEQSSNLAKANIISPLSDKNLTVKLPAHDSQFIIRDSSSSAVASIDAEGNASFAGELASDKLTTNKVRSQELEVSSDATISGTLRASRIVADQIELSEEALLSLLGLEQESTASATYITNNNPFGYDPNASSSANYASGSASFNNLFALTATFEQGLMAFGPASFFEASIADRLFVGAQLSLADRSINVLGGNLELQPLKQGGITFLGGEVEIDTDGNLKVNGNAYFAKDLQVKGNLFANIISPLPNQDLVFELGNPNQESAEPIHNSQFIIHNSSRSGVLTVNSLGDLSASGAGTFNKLNLNVVSEAQAVSPTEVIATGSAGSTQIQPNRNEVTIKNPLVTKNSLIYITLKTGIPNQSVYLLRQVPGESFTVGISQLFNKKVPFNWIIIN